MCWSSPDAEIQTVRRQQCDISENGQGREIDTFSIDVVEKQIIEDILDALSYSPEYIYLPSCLQVWRRKRLCCMAYGAAGEEDDRCGGHAYVADLSYDRSKGAAGFLPEPKRSQVRDALPDLDAGWGPGPGRVFADCGGMIQMSNFLERED